ncbi:Hypothetical protein BCAN_B0793 [Brucella canis ATCC 23365]|uniref:Uncharacterized protein n=1 Tax=Brucella canis (strain ATCC 23365 / NCTC 10854 / RM-666) TaxID=483179 RepID=A9MC66_BRUC2|nr:Hypothetical protein BCAN_B0793 [Brucella canis ATCC 23365]
MKAKQQFRLFCLSNHQSRNKARLVRIRKRVFSCLHCGRQR